MNEEEKQKRMQVIVAYITLPFVLGIPPILGWFIGTWFDKYFSTSPYGKYTLLILGMIGGVREVYRIVKKYKDEGV